MAKVDTTPQLQPALGVALRRAERWLDGLVWSRAVEAQRRADRRRSETAQARERATVEAASTAAPVAYTAAAGGVWAALRGCESGGNYAANTGNGFFGAYQFDYGTWAGMGTGYARADLAPPGVQDAAARRLQAARGWGPWPRCAQRLGLL